MQLYLKAKQYLDLKDTEKKTKADIAIINSEFKQHLKEINQKEVKTDNFEIKVAERVTETFNNEKLLNKCKELNALHLIKTIEVVDMDAFEKTLHDGEIEPTQFQDCVETKIVEVLTVKGLK